jgi:hypothetical protein
MAAGLKSECCWPECATQESDKDDARLPVELAISSTMAQLHRPKSRL